MKVEEIAEQRELAREWIFDNPSRWFSVPEILLRFPHPKHYLDRGSALTYDGSGIIRRRFNGRWFFGYFPDGDDGYSPRDFIETAKHFGHGESDAHRELKMFIADHPEEIGLPRTAKASVEHRFVSPDRADIVFEKGKKKWAVEIELEGDTNTLVGAWQAIKYRTLLCLEHDLELGDRNVGSILVAYSIPETTFEFCEKHGVEAFEVSNE